MLPLMLQRIKDTAQVALGQKAAHFPRAVPWQIFTQGGGTRIDYNRQVDPQTNSIIMACINWIAGTFPEAPAAVWSKDGEGNLSLEADHDLIALLRKPTPFYSGIALWMATILSWVLDGNAYWIKVRSGINRPVELWYVPHWMMEPKWPVGRSQTTDVFISHYAYSPAGFPIDIPVENVVHLRNGLDPGNVRKGLSPLKSLMREVWTDEEAGIYTGTILRNMGVPGIVISPKGEMTVEPTPDEVEEIKAWFQQNTTGDHRGEPIVMKGPADVHPFGFNPTEMGTRELRQIPEERVTAVLRIPAAVVGFGTGLEQTKVGATMDVMRQMAWEDNILPTQRLMAEDIRNQLLPDFNPDIRRWEFGFDISDVRVLQPDENKIAERWGKMVTDGIATVAAALEATGQDFEETDKVYLRSIAKIEVRQGQTMAEALEEQTPEPPAIDGGNGNGNGNGNGDDDDGDGAPDIRSFERWPELKARSRSQVQLINQLRRDENRLVSVFNTELTKAFQDLGNVAAVAAVLKVANLEKALHHHRKRRRKNGMPGTVEGHLEKGHDVFYEDEEKAEPTPDEIEAVRLIVESMALSDWKRDRLGPAYQGHYLRTAELTKDSINTVMQLGVDLPAPVERRVLLAGGKRLGLLDIEGDTKTAIFNALADGRTAGEGPPALVRRIRDYVPAGRFQNAGATYRSSMIARTETKFAQNVSSLEIYKDSDVVTGMLAFDNQTGFNDDDCTLRDGKIFGFDEAEREMEAEHPNGTLSFAPSTA